MQPIVVPGVVGILWTIGFFYLLYVWGDGWKREAKYRRRIRELEKRLENYESVNNHKKSFQSNSANTAAIDKPATTLTGEEISGRRLS